MASGNDQRVHPVLEENIEALRERRGRQEEQLSFQEHAARKVAEIAGSLPFVYVHFIVLAFWLSVNSGAIQIIPAWDLHYIGLATGAAIEALFLSLFILINQNRMAKIAARNADLDLHMSLLAEHEITRLVTICAAIAKKLDVQTEVDDQIPGLKRDVPAEAVLDKIDDTEEEADRTSRGPKAYSA